MIIIVNKKKQRNEKLGIYKTKQVEVRNILILSNIKN